MMEGVQIDGTAERRLMPEIHIRPISAGSEGYQRECEERWERKRKADEIRQDVWATPSRRIEASQIYWALGDHVTARRMDEQIFGRSTGGSYDSDGPAAFILTCIAFVVLLARWLLGG